MDLTTQHNLWTKMDESQKSKLLFYKKHTIAHIYISLPYIFVADASLLLLPSFSSTNIYLKLSKRNRIGEIITAMSISHKVKYLSPKSINENLHPPLKPVAPSPPRPARSPQRRHPLGPPLLSHLPLHPAGHLPPLRCLSCLRRNDPHP